MTTPVSEALEDDPPPPGQNGPDRDPPSLDGTDRAADDVERLEPPSPARRMVWPSSTTIGLGVALAASAFIFLQLRPDLLFSDTTPSGGDMGAHVWGPAYLRDHLLTSGRLTGWTPDWYAGFPAYHFYMVIPALAVIAVNSGLTPWLGVPVAAGVLLAARWLARRQVDHRGLIWSVAGVLVTLSISVPYGISFKLVSVAGLVAFPLAGWAMGRLSRCPEPVPAFLALGSLIFLFDTNFTIYGGNLASTLAGEFAFSLSLCLALLAIGMTMRAMDGHTSRASAAVVIALVALCHVIPLIFTVVALVIAVLLHERVQRLWFVAAGITVALIPMGIGGGSGRLSAFAAVSSFGVVVAAIVLADDEVRRRTRWLLAVGPVAALSSAFWLVPFYLRAPYFNDMGWERLDDVGPALLTTPMKVFLPVAAVGAVLSFSTHDRVGMLFAVLTAASASGVANLPEGKLWNARLLPFYYLSVYLLAAVGIALVVRFSAVAVSERFDRPDRRLLLGAPVVGLVAAVVAVGMPLRVLPLGQVDQAGTYEWFGLRSGESSFLPSWVSWNYSGYEEKRSYREYSEVVNVMDQVGRSNGCGRAMWEYDKGLDRYGTPMALMLLPHWTDGCIGSMEGLYFESSATTPFHFLNQSTLSATPSRAQRDLPYSSIDLDVGIAQLQVMGVRYYMALSDEATRAAGEHPDLSLVAESQPWTIFEVADSDVVTGLAYLPVVTEGLAETEAGDVANRFDVGWLGQAVDFYGDPTSYHAFPAEDGPADWERVSTLLSSDGDAIEPVEVSNIETTDESIRFEVDDIGRPVLVKTSYFPNWHADGADGPWRIGPNLMVVVPTANEVRLSYGYTSAEYLGYLLTAIGLAGLVLLAGADRRRT